MSERNSIVKPVIIFIVITVYTALIVTTTLNAVFKKKMFVQEVTVKEINIKMKERQVTKEPSSSIYKMDYI